METKNKIRLIVLVVVWALVWLCGACSSDKNLTLRTQAQAQARIAEADSAAVVSRNQAEADRFKTLADAAKPDNSVLLVVLVGFIALAILVVYKLFEVNMAVMNQAKPVVQAPRLLPAPPGREYWLLADGTVEVKRLRDGASMYVEPSDPLYKQLTG